MKNETLTNIIHVIIGVIIISILIVFGLSILYKMVDANKMIGEMKVSTEETKISLDYVEESVSLFEVTYRSEIDRLLQKIERKEGLFRAERHGYEVESRANEMRIDKLESILQRTNYALVDALNSEKQTLQYFRDFLTRLSGGLTEGIDDDIDVIERD